MNWARLFALLSLSLSACSFSGSEGEANGDGGTGGNPDGGTVDPPFIDAPPAPPRCDFEYADLCAFTARTDLVYSQNTTINTSMDAMCGHIVAQASGQPELCVIYAESIIVNANVTVRAIGTRPLMLASRKGISISGTLSASSSRSNPAMGFDPATPEVLGAGAGAMACESFAEEPEGAASGGGGGAGGSFSGKGGNGSAGAIFSGESNDGGESSNALALADVDFIRGGCRGQEGGDDGDSTNSRSPGIGGPGGGALYLAASSDIGIPMGGRIGTNGGGGRGGDFRAGGGGGGSGGMIVLEARSVNRIGMIVANGGGGGEGGATAPVVGGISGSSGSDGGMTASAANGGNNDFITGAGGNGSDATQRNGRNGSNTSAEAGGGGGGSAGFIRMITTGTNSGMGVISPPVSQ